MRIIYVVIFLVLAANCSAQEIYLLVHLPRTANQFEYELDSNLSAEDSVANDSPIALLRLAMERRHRGDFDGSDSTLNKVISYPATIVADLNTRGYANQVRNNWIAAKEDYEKAVALDNKNLESHGNFITALVHLKDFKAARKHVDALKKTFPDDPRVYIESGDVYYLSDLYKEALDDVNKAVEISKEDPAFVLNRSGVYDDGIEDDEAALADAEWVITRFPSDPRGYYYRSRPYIDKMDYDTVIRDCNKAIELNPSYYEAYVMRGNAYDLTGKVEEAITDYEKAISIKKTYPEAYLQLAVLYNSRYNNDMAEAVLDRALKNRADYIPAIRQRGLTRMERRNYKGARIEFDKIIRLSPEDGSGYYLRGLCAGLEGDDAAACKDMAVAKSKRIIEATEYIRQNCPAMISQQELQVQAMLDEALHLEEEGKLRDAIVAYTNAITQLPDSAIFYYNRGKVYRRLDEHENAIDDYTKAITNNPLFREAYVSMAVSQTYLGRNKDAIETYLRCIEVAPSYDMAYHNLAQIYSSLGMNAQAVEKFSRAVLYNNQYVNAWVGLGDNLLAIGDNEGACEAYKKAEKLGSGKAIVGRVKSCR